MKKIITLFLIPFLMSSCALPMKSVVDHSLFKQPYSNPLIVMTYDDYSVKGFSNDLKENLEIKFGAEQRNVEILSFELAGNSLTLNANKGIDQEIQTAISKDDKDLLLVFQPTNIYFGEGGYRSFLYQLTGIDTKTNKEVWKANFTAARGHFGGKKIAEIVAKTIYEKLKTDKVL